MAPSKPLLQTSESSTQEPTTVTTECSCENTENTTFTCDTVVEEETKESDSGDREKVNYKGDTGTGAQTYVDGIGNAIVEDNTQTENNPCTCDTEVEEETEESDSGDQEKADHQGDTGRRPQTTADGIGNAIVEDNTQTENTPCTCDTDVEEETEESDSGGQRRADHQGDTGTGAQTTADGIGNVIVEDNTQTENTPCTCDTVVEEETEESDSGEEENEQNGTEESGFNGGRKATHVGDKGKPTQTTIDGTQNDIIL